MYPFHFDKIFPPRTQQEKVFEEVEGLVQTVESVAVGQPQRPRRAHSVYERFVPTFGASPARGTHEILSSASRLLHSSLRQTLPRTQSIGKFLIDRSG